MIMECAQTCPWNYYGHMCLKPIDEICPKNNVASEKRPQTNADRIRAMSDEELARFLSNPCECTVDPTTDGYRECGNSLCIQYLLEWLKQPAEECQ